MFHRGPRVDEESTQPLLRHGDPPASVRTVASAGAYAEPKEAPPGLTLTFKDVTYALGAEAGAGKEILRGVSGFVRGGEMLAILGPSGAGKSTLLDILAQRPGRGTVGGEVLVNGGAVGPDAFRRLSAYVQQEDLLRGYLTVRESVSFAAQLRTPPSLAAAELRARTGRIMRLLGIDGVQDARVGSAAVRGISGGERKRCAIAMELVASPALIFLDEPTTGLDAFTALHLLTILKDLALAGVAVVFSIHQPRSSAFQLFDQILLLNDRGEEAYFGHARDAMPFLASLGVTPSLPENPADFLLDAVAAPPAEEMMDGGEWLRRHHVACACGGPNVAAAFRGRLLVGVEREIDAVNDALAGAGTQGAGEAVAAASPYFRSVWTQIRVVALRAVINKLRDPIATFAAVVAAVFFALVIGSVYFRLGLDQPSVRNRMGVLFFVAMNTTFSSLGGLSLLMAERAIFIREHRNGMYRAVAYFIGKILQDVPISVVANFMFDTIVYFMVGLQPRADKFFLFYLVCTLIMLNSYALCLLVSNLSRDMQVANVVAPLVFVLYLLPSGGVLMSVDSLPLVWRWIKYVSFVRYGLEALVINEFDGLTFTCAANETYCVRDGKTYAELQGFHARDFWRAIAASAGSVGVYLLLAYAALVLLRARGGA
ncbi:putative ATP-binding cassette protein [Trypanosoma conorhini]|uniref:Putative ATP-binding cassette protein n=1 Tax=Trypanosoma conorhini TaxID=83891 RepID=A0A422PQ75_9TRYP|nr:putative ATP-binding cassette protein [Trypanosoma conorhini]RNF19896.1 putative ATP-binding cassette protein [Trypanosoma conorhini]